MVVTAVVSRKLEEIVRFQEQEYDAFWNRFYPLQEVRDDFFKDIDTSTYQLLREKTQEGLRQGVNGFLDSLNPRPAAIYLAPKEALADFCYDNLTAKAICQQLRDTVFGVHQNLDDYCREVCSDYRLYVRNESGEKFNERFVNAPRAQCG